ncbi:MAG: hypothetical protein GY793_06115 [Proteobacteria bacterium]|nr:hypothetical protein [Pseudomonadota bacterium]
MKKQFLSIIALGLMTACSANHENYYLREYDVSSNLQEQRTSEVIFNNIVYAKMLNTDQAMTFFGPELEGYSLVFFKAQNIGDETSYFDFKNAKILAKEDKISSLVKIPNLIPTTEINLSDIDSYKNPFKDIEMEDNNFVYNLNKDILTNFSLDPNQSKSGVLIFRELDKAEKLDFIITSGTSIYTAKEYEIALDFDE